VNPNKVEEDEESGVEEDEESETEEQEGAEEPENNTETPDLVPRDDYDSDDSDDEDDDEPPATAGVDTIGKTGVPEGDKEEAEAKMNQKYGPRKHSRSLRNRKPPNYAPRYDPDNFDTSMAQFEQPMGMLFMTEQMSLKRGLKRFGKAGADAVVSEMKQLEIRKVFKPTNASDLTRVQKKAALEYLMYLKQKRCGRIKGRGCADGRKQRLYKTKEETSSPTVTTEALFLTSLVDAEERRKVVTVDIPGAFMHSDMDELVHVRLTGPMATLLVRVDPAKYRKYVVKDRKGNDMIYVELEKALYGTCQAALLFWKNLSSFLIDELGFTLNKYDKCVANKMIDGKQCTIIWHVDDLKMSHVSSAVLDSIIDRLDEKYGNEAPLTVTRGTVHEYLGMTIDFSEEGKVKFIMNDYVENLLDEVPEDMSGHAATPAANHLFAVNDKAEKLDNDDSEKYHHLTAKLLYLSKRARPDLQLAVAFLCKRVKQPDVDDWKKLGRCLRYLRGTKELILTLESDGSGAIQWWIDASFAVHPDMKSHTGITMSLGKGSPFSCSTSQKLNTKSSTEAELVGVDDGMALIIWTRNFMIEQGYKVKDNVVYQDNQSAILLERNGRASSGRRTRHVNIRYFFVTDRVKSGELRIEYCPTGDMWGDFFTKPTQGSLFKRQRAQIMNLPAELPLPITTPSSKECVATSSYADVVRSTGRMMLSQAL
jgi:hypothetical protein